MKKTTRILALAIALTLCLGLMPAISFAEAPVELTVLTMRWGDMGDSFTSNQFLVDLEKELNVKINWITRSNNDWNEQKGILLAGGELPDIFIGNETIKDGDILANLDFFLPLDDLIANYMPNYQHALEVYPAFRSVTTFPDGTIRSFAKIQPCRPMTRNQPIINKTWLDNLGLAVPTTTEELKNVLIAFKEQDPNGNGLADEIPFSHNGDIHIDMLNSWGIVDINESLMLLEGDSAVFFPTTDAYKEGVKYARELWEAGVIDPETFTQDWSMITGKWTNEEVPVVGLTFQWTPDAVMGKWSDQYIAIAPLANPDGERYAGGDKDGVFAIMGHEAEITKDCKNPEIAAKWLDAFYTNEASIQNFWGAIGTVITKNEDGTYVLNDPPEGTSADAWYWDQSLRDFGPKFVEPGFSDKILLSKESGDGLKLELSKMADPYVKQSYPSVIFTEEENNELSLIGTDIAEYVRQMRAKWVTEGGIDEDWDTYVEQLNAMGLERFVQIKVDALKR